MVFAGEKTAVTVTFSQFFAEASPSTPMSANRKACQMTFGLNVPPGFTFGIANVDSVSRLSYHDKEFMLTLFSTVSADTISSTML